LSVVTFLPFVPSSLKRANQADSIETASPPTRSRIMSVQTTAQTIAAPQAGLSPTERYRMSTAPDRTASAPRWMLWTGWFFSFVVVAQLLSSAFFRAAYHSYAVAEIVTGYGYPESAIVLIVMAECALVLLYLVPQTSVLAAILMTGYLGGAVATHLRIADTARAAIPLVVGILAWGGLYLRDSRIRQLVPFRRSV
jgi:hypothetical protein